MRLRPIFVALTLGITLLLSSGCAHNPPSNPSDPLEPINRAVFTFNNVVDNYTLKPVARAYDYVIPDVVQTGIGNFFSNLFYPKTIINNFLQGKPGEGASDVWRFLINTTLGIGGIFDPATQLGFKKHNEDFGQTLGSWGVGEGWYLMLPLLGPSTVRDSFSGYGVDWVYNPLTYAEIEPRIGAAALNAIHTRAGLLPLDSAVREAPDSYVFVRSAVLQRRLKEVFDGNPPDLEPDYEDQFDDIDGF